MGAFALQWPTLSWRSDERVVDGEPPPTFVELIGLHTAMGESRNPDAIQAYKDAWRRFTALHGSVDEVYWGADGKSGVVLTLRRGWRPSSTDAWLDRVSDETTKNSPDITGAIHNWEIFAVKAQTLRDENQRVLMRWIFAAISHLINIAAVDKDRRLTDDERKSALAAQQVQMNNAHAYYVANARRCAYFDYFYGMMRGTLVNIVLAIGLALFARYAVPFLWPAKGTGNSNPGVDLQRRAIAEAFGCVVAGGLGTVFSVVLRMTVGSFDVDYEMGPRRLKLIGSFRPFIGAASGLALFFAAEAGILRLPNSFNPPEYGKFYVLAFFAFLAGFSERFARDTFLGAEEDEKRRARQPASGIAQPVVSSPMQPDGAGPPIVAGHVGTAENAATRPGQP